MSINAYPLQWPTGWKRTPEAKRQHGHFNTKTKASASYRSAQPLTVAQAVQRVLAELQRWAVDREDIVVSTNVKLRLDGLPRSDQKAPDDAGAAVYWVDPFNAARRCIAVDRYHKVEHNLAAIAATLDAMRAIERHGGAAVIERAFTGFVALPAPGAADVARDWWDVLGVPRQSTREAVKVAFRRLASEVHTDKPGGSHDLMAALNVARDEALKECFE